ncbi:MAG: sterol desaturase [Chitinophagales bacterium]|nr:MAG: sterol desaturase [Chitinophagales bacterium]
MEAYAQALNIAIPVFLVLILLEFAYSRIKGLKTSNSMDTISSLSSGITNVTKDVLGLSIAVVSYSWLEQRIGIFDIKSGVLAYVLAFIGKDFAGYWIHRMEHRVNFFWNRHIIHHSSEEFNLPCALRQSVSEIFSFSAFFLFPMALIGVPAEVFAVVAPIHLFLQFWYHTRHIGRLGFLEYFLVTPSHHRVHHAINPEYLDKNFSQIFIIWDKLFGTFQEEKKDIPPVYGVKRPVRTWNPLIINFQHAWLVIRDACRTRSWWDKARIWFMPTGWRPPDVAEKYPVETLEDVYSLKKYAPKASKFLIAWSYLQLIVTLLLSLYLFNRIAYIPYEQVLLYGGFIFYSVFSYTTLMDRKSYAWVLEGIRALLGISVIVATGDWFYLSEIIPAGDLLVAGYFVLSWAVVGALVKWDINREEHGHTSHALATSSVNA